MITRLTAFINEILGKFIGQLRIELCYVVLICGLAEHLIAVDKLHLTEVFLIDPTESPCNSDWFVDSFMMVVFEKLLSRLTGS